MRKDLFILFSILLMSQGLSASPVPEPQFTLMSLLYGSGAWVANVVVTPIVRAVRYVFALTTRMVTQISTSVVTIIRQVNVTVAENVEIFNKTCSKAVEDMTVEYNIFQKESTSLNAAVTVLCSGALLSANDNVIQVAYGATTFLNAISGFGPPRPSNNTGTFGDAPRYPIPQSPMPAAPAPGAVSPPPPAISVQARYARTVSNRILSDILALVHVVDEFKETTGSTTECMSTTEVQTLKESFINITMILTKYENMSTASRLITVLTNEELEQINIAITRMNKAVELVQNSLKSGVKEIKNARKVNAYETTVKEVKENKKTSEEFSKKLSDIRKNNEKSGRRVVSRVFNTARDSSNKAYQNITTARNSLVEKSTSVIKTIRDNSFWIYEYIVKPKLNSLQVKLDKIPVCLTSIFGNLTVSIRSINNITDVTNNKTYQNASMVISQAVTNLTDIIAKDFKINCAQASNDEIQEIQCKFHRDSKNCLEQTSVFNQRAVTNCTNTTIFISQILNDIVAKTDKCIRDAGAPNTYYINFLGYFVRQKIAVCLDPIDRKAGNFCTDASKLSNGTRLSVMSVSSQTTSSYKNCTNIKVKEALNAIKVASETYFTCSKTQPTASPTKIVASTTSGISTTERTTTPIAPTEGTPN